jgi:hypothetical protein
VLPYFKSVFYLPSLAKVMMTLRYLAGSRWVDIVRIHGVNKPALYFCIQQVIRAIIRRPLVGKPKLPTDKVKAKECMLNSGQVLVVLLMVIMLF